MKMTDQFDRLMAELQDLLDDATHCDTPRGVSFWFDDAEFALVHVREPKERLTVYIKFGHFPPDAPADEYMRLLETNLLLARSCGGAFGAIDTTREVVYAFQMPMQDMTAALLLDSLRCASVQARTWRLTHPLAAGDPDDGFPRGSRWHVASLQHA